MPPVWWSARLAGVPVARPLHLPQLCAVAGRRSPFLLLSHVATDCDIPCRPQADGIWRCYQNFAQWAGALYRRVANRDPSRHRNTPRGDVTDVDAAELTQVVQELLPLVAARRAAAGVRGSGTRTGAGAAVQQEEGEEL